MASAVIIQPIAPTTNMGSGFGSLLLNTTNGIGLMGNVPSLSASHASTMPTNSWVSGGGVLTGFVDFNLNAPAFVDGFSLWNQNSGGPGNQGSTGIRSMDVSYSLDGLLFLPLLGAPSAIERVTVNGPVAPAVFSFPPVNASHIRFKITSNHGDPGQTGFAEVQFNRTVIPEPGTALVGVLTMGTAIGSLRSRRRAVAARMDGLPR